MENQKTFLDIDNPNYADCKVVIVPFGYERTTSFLKGTENGPKAIISASSQLELYDIETDSEPYLEGIYTMEEMADNSATSEAAIAEVYTIVGDVIRDGKLPVLLGGEHTISIGAVRTCKDKYPELSVLQIDAHADLRDVYDDSKYSHACVMKRIGEITPYVGIGIRSVGPEEIKEFKIKRENGEIFTPDDFRDLGGLNEIIEKLTSDVYITIDADGFDPSIIPGVGTPEPEGLNYEEILELLKAIARERNIIGFDFVELRPLRGEVRSEFAAAKLIYKMLAYIFQNN